MAIRVVDTDVWSYIYKGREEATISTSPFRQYPRNQLSNSGRVIAVDYRASLGTATQATSRNTDAKVCSGAFFGRALCVVG